VDFCVVGGSSHTLSVLARHPEGGNPRRADRQILTTPERGKKPIKLEKYQRSWSAFSEASKATSEPLEGNQNSPRPAASSASLTVGAYNRTLKGKPAGFPQLRLEVARKLAPARVKVL
jgi:hypothetical protein